MKGERGKKKEAGRPKSNQIKIKEKEAEERRREEKKGGMMSWQYIIDVDICLFLYMYIIMYMVTLFCWFLARCAVSQLGLKNEK